MNIVYDISSKELSKEDSLSPDHAFETLIGTKEQKPLLLDKEKIYDCVDECVDGNHSYGPHEVHKGLVCANFDDDDCLEFGPNNGHTCNVGDVICYQDYVYECIDANLDGYRELWFAGLCVRGCSKGTCNTKSNCIDSDSGADYYNKGVAYMGKQEMNDIYGGYKKTFPEGSLRECVCRPDGNIGNVLYVCPTGCEDGACI